MPSVYTIEGAKKNRRRRRRGKTTQQRLFGAAAKRCKGLKKSAFKRCMKKELRS